MKQEIFRGITKKKEFSQLPEKDVERAFSHFEKRQTTDEEKIKLTRDLLRKSFSVFTSKKLLSLKNKDEEWILRKHISTRERLPYYGEIYKRIFRNLNNELNVIDLGAGINGFSYKYFRELRLEVNYVGVEAIGQLVDLMNFYFKKEKLNGKAVHLSLFELEKVKALIKNQEGQKVIFLFKTPDSLEMLERDYSLKLLNEIAPLADRVIVSFATRSIRKREKFRAERNWILKVIKENFNILDDFEIDGERYVVFKRK